MLKSNFYAVLYNWKTILMICEGVSPTALLQLLSALQTGSVTLNHFISSSVEWQKGLRKHMSNEHEAIYFAIYVICAAIYCAKYVICAEYCAIYVACAIYCVLQVRLC